MSDNLTNLTHDSQAIWDQNAEAWDGYMGEGGSFQRELIGPATERLLDVQPGKYCSMWPAATGPSRAASAIGPTPCPKPEAWPNILKSTAITSTTLN